MAPPYPCATPRSDVVPARLELVEELVAALLLVTPRRSRQRRGAGRRAPGGSHGSSRVPTARTPSRAIPTARSRSRPRWYPTRKQAYASTSSRPSSPRRAQPSRKRGHRATTADTASRRSLAAARARRGGPRARRVARRRARSRGCRRRTSPICLPRSLRRRVAAPVAEEHDAVAEAAQVLQVESTRTWSGSAAVPPPTTIGVTNS